jgi:hypothetical protein
MKHPNILHVYPGEESAHPQAPTGNADERNRDSNPRYTRSCASAVNIFVYLLIGALLTANVIEREMKEWYKRSLEENRSCEWLILKFVS